MALCTLYHRLGHVTPFSPYATLLIAPNGSLSLQPEHPLDLASSTLESSTLDRLYYYLALQCDDQPQSSWHLSSVKAVCLSLSFPGHSSHPSQCYLPHATSQTLILHTDNSKPFAVDYFVSPIPQDASCPNVPSKTTFVESIRALNTTVIFKLSHSPPLYEAFLFNSPHSRRFRPQLRSPLPLTPTGRPVQPLPHKSFLQKYWMYIALFLLALGSSLKHVHSVTDLHGPLVLTNSEDTGPRRHAQA